MDETLPAYRGHEPYVFVSYAHADAAAVREEIRRLHALGYRVYYDDHIQAGSHWHDELAEAIEAAAAFLLFVSPRSVESANCQRELAFALSEDVPVVPVHLEATDLPAGTRMATGNRQAIFRYQIDDSTFARRLDEALSSLAAKAPTAVLPSAAQSRWRAWWLLPAALLLLIAYLGVREQRAGEDYTPIIEQARTAVLEDDYGAAFTLLHPLMQTAAAQDPTLKDLWAQIINPMVPVVAEPGATVSFKPYASVDSPWVAVGTTPIETPVDAPKGVLRLKVEKPGFVTGRFAVANPGPSLRTSDRLGTLKVAAGIAEVPLALAPQGSISDDMVLVPETNAPVFLLGWSRNVLGDNRHAIPGFAIGRREITNAEFKKFVDAGGYENDVYWAGLQFTSNGAPLTAAQAKALMVDTTGRPGPSGWSLGSFAAGTGQMPVGGVSWYEAVAYARFRGLTLPTVHHWLRAAHAPYEGLFNTAPAVAGLSNFASDGPEPAADGNGTGPWGTLDMAGNMREWIWNGAGDRVLVLGGGWSDYAATYQAAHTADRMDRSPQHGIRLMQLLEDAVMPAALLEPIALSGSTDEPPRAPVTDEVFANMRFRFTAASRAPLATSVSELASTDLWRAEMIELSYGESDDFSLVVVRPRDTAGTKLQAVLYAPPGDAVSMSRPNRAVLGQVNNFEHVVQSGRAVVVPIWWGSYQRFEPRPQTTEAWTTRQQQAPLRWYRDAVSALDYIATREDLDATKIGMMGISYGANFILPVVMAVEGRVRSAVVISGGITPGAALDPMVDAVNYLPRITQPVLMINGRYDHVFPYQQSQRRYFELLGTPARQKAHKVYDVGHFAFPGHAIPRDVADWFDATLGPVR